MIELGTMKEGYVGEACGDDKVGQKKGFPNLSKLPVDCLAFWYMYLGTDSDGRVTFHYSICNHPKRNGPVMGCLLTTEEGSDNEIKEREGGQCPHRVGVGSEGVDDYLERVSKSLEFDEIF